VKLPSTVTKGRVADAWRAAGKGAARALWLAGRPLARAGRALGAVRARPRTIAFFSALLLAVVVAIPLLGQISPDRLLSFTRTGAWPTPTATSAATPPTGTPDPHASDWMQSLHAAAERAYVDSLIAHMTLDEELGQMIMIEFLGTEMPQSVADQLSQLHVGSVVLYKWNVSSADGLRQLDHQLQAHADKIPLLIASDQEGGYVNRLAIIDGALPSAEQMGATNNPTYVYQRGQQDGRQLYGLGINMNLAPVVDVQGIPDGESVMGTRMFGWTPDKVTTMAGAYLNGLQDGHHVVGTLKHFPGLGDVYGDPHAGPVALNRSVSDMERIDWAPYRNLIATGQVEAIMTTHVIVPALDPNLPATISYPITAGILRDKLGFQGVIITDGIYMNAIARYPIDQILVGAVLAGHDIICSTTSYYWTAYAIRVLKQAVADGRISKQRVDDSVRRILTLKLHYGLLQMPKSA